MHAKRHGTGGTRVDDPRKATRRKQRHIPPRLASAWLVSGGSHAAWRSRKQFSQATTRTLHGQDISHQKNIAQRMVKHCQLAKGDAADSCKARLECHKEKSNARALPLICFEGREGTGEETDWTQKRVGKKREQHSTAAERKSTACCRCAWSSHLRPPLSHACVGCGVKGEVQPEGIGKISHPVNAGMGPGAQHSYHGDAALCR